MTPEQLDAIRERAQITTYEPDVCGLRAQVEQGREDRVALLAELTAATDDANKYADRVCDLEWLLQHHGIDIPDDR
ncbi:MAG TPA: hypothetical protein VKZ89_01745 [Thermobifida alba]|nr:hypothetical protein [Thermobifida alba]